MADTEENVKGLKKVVLLGPNQDWKQYFLRNPTLVFEDMRVVEIVKLEDENSGESESDEPFDCTLCAHVSNHREVRHVFLIPTKGSKGKNPQINGRVS